MGTRLPRNFAINPINGAYGDEEDRLAQAISDAGIGGTSGGGITVAQLSTELEQIEETLNSLNSSNSVATVRSITSNLTNSQTLYTSGKNHIIYNNTGDDCFVRLGGNAASNTSGGFSYIISNGQAVNDTFEGTATFICGPNATGFVNITDVSDV